METKTPVEIHSSWMLPNRPLETVEIVGIPLVERGVFSISDSKRHRYVMVSMMSVALVVDLYSMAIIGYGYFFRPRLTADDVIQCAEKVVRPWRPRTLSIPGLHYPLKGGCPSGVLREYRWALWDHMILDTTYALLSLGTLYKTYGFNVHISPSITKYGRIVFESFIENFEVDLFEINPCISGNEITTYLRYRFCWHRPINLENILDIIDVAVSTCNVVPQGISNIQTPMEILENYVLENGRTFRTVYADII